MVFKYPEIEIISFDRIAFFEPNIQTGEVRKVCRNSDSKNKNYKNREVCDEKYNDLFISVKKS